MSVPLLASNESWVVPNSANPMAKRHIVRVGDTKALCGLFKAQTTGYNPFLHGTRSVCVACERRKRDLTECKRSSLSDYVIYETPKTPAFNFDKLRQYLGEYAGPEHRIHYAFDFGKAAPVRRTVTITPDEAQNLVNHGDTLVKGDTKIKVEMPMRDFRVGFVNTFHREQEIHFVNVRARTMREAAIQRARAFNHGENAAVLVQDGDTTRSFKVSRGTPEKHDFIHRDYFVGTTYYRLGKS